MTRSSLLAPLVAACATAGLALPSLAATDFSFTNLSGAEYDTAGVFVLGDYTFTGTTDDGGGLDEVEFRLYDDGSLKFSQTSSVAVGGTGTFHFETYYPGLVGTSARGVGLYLVDDGGFALFIDPYDVPHYADPSECQKDCGPVTGVPEPETYALMLGGLGIVGWMTRRRASRAA